MPGEPSGAEGVSTPEAASTPEPLPLAGDETRAGAIGGPSETEATSQEPQAAAPARTCTADLPACEAGATAPCSLHCEVAANGCAEVAELVPLSVLDGGQDGFAWAAMDPDGQFAVYHSEFYGNSFDHAWFRWSAAEGLVAIDDELRQPDDDGEVELLVSEVGSGAGALRGLRVTDDDRFEEFYWARGSGLKILDFEAARMSPDGTFVAGLRSGKAVRWAPDTETQELSPGASLESDVRVAGDAVLFVDGASRIVKYRASTGLVAFAAPADMPAGAPLGLAAVNADGTIVVGRVGDAAAGEGTRLFASSEASGARWLAQTPLPAGSFHSNLLMSADGSAVVGDMALRDGSVAAAFRWTLDGGVQGLDARARPAEPLLDMPAHVHPTYISPDGNVVIGYRGTGSGTANGVRWSAAGLDAPSAWMTWSNIALGGDLLVTAGPNGAVLANVYGSAQDRPLPVERLQQFVPSGWSRPDVLGVSENGRLIGGSAVNPAGERQAWVIQLRQRCDTAPGQ